MQMRVGLFAMAIIFTPSSLANAGNPEWTPWEWQLAVAKDGVWLVIRQPGVGFCYLKQSYDNDPGHMEITMKADGIPFLVLPFFRGVQGDVTYRVDQGPLRIIPEDDAHNPIALSSEIVPELKMGNTLTVRIKPTGRTTQKQHFSLVGFTAAVQWFHRKDCLP